MDPIVIVTDSVMGAAPLIRRLTEEGWTVAGVIGTLTDLLALPDGTRLLVHEVTGRRYADGGVCAAARLLIARGNFSSVDLAEKEKSQ